MRSHTDTNRLDERWPWILALGFVAFAGLVLTSACTGDSSAPATGCRGDADCNSGLVCVDNMCVDNRPRDAGKRDAGRPILRIDAGAHDAGKPETDRDSGRPDTGMPDSSVDGRLDAGVSGDICGSMACDVQGAMCGEVEDDCGDNIDCGDCSSGQDCRNHQCVTCQQRSCSGRCGWIDDGCGGRRDCGNGCNSGQQCQNNRCVSCERSCHGRCGVIKDDCGNNQNCGGCDANETCSQYGWCQCEAEVEETDWHYPSSHSGSTWVNRVNVLHEDGVGTYVDIQASTPLMGTCNNGRVTLPSGVIQVGGFGFNIPNGATIIGIVPEIWVRVDPAGTNPGGSWNVEEIQLTTGNSRSENKGANWLITAPTHTYRQWQRGGNQDTWGRQWTPAQINANNFTVRLMVENTVDCEGTERKRLFLDTMRVKVWYRPSSC